VVWRGGGGGGESNSVIDVCSQLNGSRDSVVVDIGPIHTMRHVSVPSPFHLRYVRMVSVHTVRRVQPPATTAHDRRPATISIKFAAHCHGMYFVFFFC